MRHVSVAELKANAEELIAAAEAGEDIVIAGEHHGLWLVPTVQQVMGQIALTESRRAALEDLARFRAELRDRGVTVTQAEIKEWINEGRP